MLWLLGMWLAAASVPSGQHERGVDLYKQQKYADAIAALQAAVKDEKPDSSEYRESALLIGQSYFMLSQAPTAIPWLEKVPNINEANFMLGYAYLQTKEREKSETAFARLFGVQANSAAGHLVAGQMMLKREYEQEAVAEVEIALKLNPNMPEAHFLLGEVHIYRGQLDQGIDDMNRELGLNPNFSMAWYRLGDAYTRKQDWATAIPNLQRAVWLNPSYSGPYILLGKCYLKTGKLPDSEKILRAAINIDPNNREGSYLLAQTLTAEGKTEEAKGLFEKLRPAK